MTTVRTETVEVLDASNSERTKRLNEAAKQHATADRLAKQADKMKAEARDVLLDSFKPDDAGRVSAPWRFEGGATYVGQFEEAEVKVTIPMSAPVPARVEDERAHIAANRIIALLGDTAGIFRVRYEFDPEAFREFIRSDTDDDIKLRIEGIVRDAETPAKPSQPLAPRVSSKLYPKR